MTKTKPKTRVKRSDIVAALKACGGGVYLAAAQLSCRPGTIYKRMEKDADLRAIVADIRGEMVDIAESSLKRAVISGDAWAVCFTLKCLAKDRGYIERQEVELTGKDGGALLVKIDR